MKFLIKIFKRNGETEKSLNVKPLDRKPKELINKFIMDSMIMIARDANYMKLIIKDNPLISIQIIKIKNATDYENNEYSLFNDIHKSLKKRHNKDKNIDDYVYTRRLILNHLIQKYNMTEQERVEIDKIYLPH